MRYVAAGLDAAVYRKAPELEYPCRLLGEQESYLAALACSAPPEGRKRWTLRLLAERLVALEVVESVSYETVRPGLKANRLDPWSTARWCIPPEQDGEFCWRMEDVLAVYTRPYDPRRPQVCLDETSRELVAEVRPPRPVGPGRPARQDYEYERRGVCNLFVVFEPLRGWRDVLVSDRRTRIDWAHCVKDLLEVDYPGPRGEQVVELVERLDAAVFGFGQERLADIAVEPFLLTPPFRGVGLTVHQPHAEHGAGAGQPRVGEWGSVVAVEHLGQAAAGDGAAQQFLAGAGVLVGEEPAVDQQPAVVVDDQKQPGPHRPFPFWDRARAGRRARRRSTARSARPASYRP